MKISDCVLFSNYCVFKHTESSVAAHFSSVFFAPADDL